MIAQAKAAAVRRYGLGPVLEWKLALSQGRHIPSLFAHEIREARAAPAAAPVEITTIIPTIGRPSLRDAVESAMAQDLDRSHRVLVVTDGPWDLPSLSPETTVLKTSRNCRVVGVVRNIGLRTANSLYTAFLDDDNVWRPDHLRSAIAALESTGADLVFASAARRRPDGTLFDEIGGPWNRCAAANENFVDASAIVARGTKIRFSRVPRPVGVQFSEDWELVWRVGRRGHIEWTGNVTMDYTLSPELIQLLEQQKAGM